MNDANLEYIRSHYSVPANKGTRIRYTGGSAPKEGVIKKGVNSYIHVLFDGEKNAVNLHPTWKVEYL